MHTPLFRELKVLPIHGAPRPTPRLSVSRPPRHVPSRVPHRAVTYYILNGRQRTVRLPSHTTELAESDGDASTLDDRFLVESSTDDVLDSLDYELGYNIGDAHSNNPDIQVSEGHIADAAGVFQLCGARTLCNVLAVNA